MMSVKTLIVELLAVLVKTELIEGLPRLLLPAQTLVLRHCKEVNWVAK